MARTVRFEGARLLKGFLSDRSLSLTDAASALSVTAVAIHAWVSGRNRPRPQYRESIDVWTSGTVPASAWEKASERKSVVAVKPWVPAKTGTDS